MTDDREILEYLLTHPEAPIDEAWVRSMELKYPYFSLPTLMSMREEGKRDPAQMHKMLLTCGETDTLRSLLDPQAPSDEGFYPPAEPTETHTTTQTIDTFLSTYGGNDPTETATLEQLIFNPVADYSQTLAREAACDVPSEIPTGDSQDDRINRFLLNQGADTAPDEIPVEVPHEAEPKPKPARKQSSRKNTPQPADDTLLSESLAKIYIKTRRYERAYEILSHLSLAFPEKSAYFADQMRFLRMLILNEEYRRKREKK